MSQTIQLRRGSAAEWTVANPVLAQGEIGIELDTGLFKVGDGSSAWNALDYSTLRSIDEITVALLSEQATPAPPASGKLNLYAKSLAGRMLLRTQGPSGIATPLQPSFFQNNIVMINTSATTAVGVIGNTVTSVGTLSHPAVTEAYGYMTNFAGAGTANITCGTGNLTLLWQRGSIAGGSGGFFFNARLAYPDSNYNETGASTGSRTFVGLTSNTMAVSVGADDPVGHRCGFFRRSVNGAAIDANWQFSCKDGVAADNVDTGMAFAAEKVYDFYIFCPPQGTIIYWRIDNVTDGTTAEGATTIRLPGATTLMRGGFQVATVDAVVRNIRMQRVYVESDR